MRERRPASPCLLKTLLIIFDLLRPGKGKLRFGRDGNEFPGLLEFSERDANAMLWSK